MWGVLAMNEFKKEELQLLYIIYTNSAFHIDPERDIFAPKLLSMIENYCDPKNEDQINITELVNVVKVFQEQFDDLRCRINEVHHLLSTIKGRAQ
jgi:hypothetical protein